MRKYTIAGLLLTALASPVALFWLLISRSHFSILAVAAIAVATGWVLNLAWAFAVDNGPSNEPSQATGDFFAVAARFGWVCPSVLVFLTWLVLHFITGGGT